MPLYNAGAFYISTHAIFIKTKNNCQQYLNISVSFIIKNLIPGIFY